MMLIYENISRLEHGKIKLKDLGQKTKNTKTINIYTNSKAQCLKTTIKRLKASQKVEPTKKKDKKRRTTKRSQRTQKVHTRLKSPNAFIHISSAKSPQEKE
ncbi:Hypothetical_protein [Hexamita inflata]|uniref:Hypothetical_protein n=1 Tax=Hexamita inflata TaxID=28002 RepID=A0AA86V2J6_9EUKA|nr:Hypothetical protein HINF_LOCUS37088 [Hexamita inflata]CAI9973766.1 Hypothetical protein HINF_LOCUS61411 [Hexamita inflata]